MSTLVFAAVLLAALLHASWNAMVKGGQDKRVNMTAVVLGHAPIALVMLLLVPMPAVASWPWIGAGMLAHFGYQIFLLRAYSKGDLSQVYPIARGAAPLIVTVVSTFVLGIVLAPLHIVAILMIAFGLMSMALVKDQSGARNLPAAKLALITGCFIASYSLIDGIGARISGSPWGFYAWLGLANAVVFAVYMGWRDMAVLRTTLSHGRKVLILGGSASYVAYALVIWAFTQAPIAVVTALRETSIIFAMLIGVFFFGEKMSAAKGVAVVATLGGAALLRFG